MSNLRNASAAVAPSRRHASATDNGGAITGSGLLSQSFAVEVRGRLIEWRSRRLRRQDVDLNYKQSMIKLKLAVTATALVALIAYASCGCASKPEAVKPGPSNAFAKSVPTLTPAQLQVLLAKKFHSRGKIASAPHA